MSGVAKAVEQRRRTERHNDALLAIATSDTAPTRREIALETNRSKRQVTRILGELREEDRIRRFRDDDDGRIIRYKIATRTDR